MLYDLHTHTLFGIDHGVQTYEDYLQNLEEYAKNGFDTLVFTPHIYHPTVASNIGAIRENFLKATEAAKEKGIRTLLGSELYLDSQTDVKSIPINGTYALVEFPPQYEPMALDRKLKQLQDKGLQVIIAHVERYKWVKANSVAFDKLYRIGVYFQSNVSGVEDRSALPYIKNGVIDIIASDNHGDPTLPGRLKRILDSYPYILDRMQCFNLE
ncbi:MAG: capsule biosynthesis protein CapC [Spirochaetales bacterium]|nr:capsule biosynthesis protein CapC [Candidatus Physcosoma equi]